MKKGKRKEFTPDDDSSTQTIYKIASFPNRSAGTIFKGKKQKERKDENNYHFSCDRRFPLNEYVLLSFEILFNVLRNDCRVCREHSYRQNAKCTEEKLSDL